VVVVCAQSRQGLRTQFVEPPIRGVPGVAESRDGLNAGQQQITTDEMGEAEVGMACDEAIDLVQRRIQLLPIDFLEHELEPCIGSIEARRAPGLAGVADGRSEDENRSRQQ
jgi:hypothetical protein